MRPPREDHAGADWLITNRGLAKRAVFETKQDVERFLDALAELVDARLIEVYAFVFLTTHFHLLVRSLKGGISEAMKLGTNAFVRWFNRSRKRDGPLFGGRFHGRRIDDPEHWLAALRYIDLNPVRARMCAVPSDHPHGSARAYGYGVGPAWLSRQRVVSSVAEFFHPDPRSKWDYDQFVCAVDPTANAYVVERLARHPQRRAPPLTDLIRTASRHQQSWMEWKAALADGMQVGTAFLPPAEALRVASVVHRRLTREELPIPADALHRDLAAGLLRTTAARTVAEIAGDLEISRSTAHAALRRHDAWMGASNCYADVVARALQGAVRRVFPAACGTMALPRRIGSSAEVGSSRPGSE